MGAFTSKLCTYSSRLSAESLDEALDFGSMFSDLGSNIKSFTVIKMKAGKNPHYAAILNGEMPPKQTSKIFGQRTYFYVGNVKEVKKACQTISTQGAACPVNSNLRHGLCYYTDTSKIQIDGTAVSSTELNKLRALIPECKNRMVGIANTSPKVGLAKCLLNILNSGRTYFKTEDLAREDAAVYAEFLQNPDVITAINDQYAKLRNIRNPEGSGSTDSGTDSGTPEGGTPTDGGGTPTEGGSEEGEESDITPENALTVLPYVGGVNALASDMYDVAQYIEVAQESLQQHLNGLDTEDKDYAAVFAKQKKFAQTGKGGGSEFLSKFMSGVNKAMQTGADAWDSQMRRRPRTG